MSSTGKMCTPSTGEMYRLVHLDDPDTFPGTFVDNNADDPNSIHVVNSEDDESCSPDGKILQDGSSSENHK
jgi:hypothetical protein